MENLCAQLIKEDPKLVFLFENLVVYRNACCHGMIDTALQKPYNDVKSLFCFVKNLIHLENMNFVKRLRDEHEKNLQKDNLSHKKAKLTKNHPKVENTSSLPRASTMFSLVQGYESDSSDDEKIVVRNTNNLS